MRSLSLKKTLKIIAFACLLISCEKDSIIEEPIESEVDIGSFKLLSESIALIPYSGKEKVIFQDSMDNETEFQIKDYPVNPTLGASFFKYNVIMDGDTVTYRYDSERKFTQLVNSDLEINFNLSLVAKPYYNDPESGLVSDILSIFWYDQLNLNTGYSVFSYVINQRTSPEVFYTDYFSQLEFCEKEFSEVLKTNYTNPKSEVYYSVELGVISFTDKENKTWCFKELK